VTCTDEVEEAPKREREREREAVMTAHLKSAAITPAI
jgi:predicted nucleic acid-binding Zn ribbon protein